MVYQKHSKMVARRIRDEVMLVPILNNAADIQSLFTLNETAARVWELIDGNNQEEDIVRTLVAEHEVDPDQAQADLSSLLSELKEIGAIEELQR